MTTITATHPATTRSASRSRSRTLNVLRLHLTNKWTPIGMPLVILGALFGGSYVIWSIIYASAPIESRADAIRGTQYSGASTYLYIYMFVIALQCITRTFPFALGFSVSRKHFALGTALLFAVQTALFTVILTGLSYIEEATAGWGVGGHMFSTVWTGTGSLGQRLSENALLFLFFFFVGSVIALVYLRWRSTGMLVLWGGVGVLGLATVASIIATNSGPRW